MDIYHLFGSDLTLSSSGDILGVEGTEEVRQRVIRRLCSNPDDLLFHPEYGAGLPRRVGSLLERGPLEAMVRAQMNAEAGVAQDPAPEVNVEPFAGGATVSIRYRDAVTGEPAGAGFDVRA